MTPAPGTVPAAIVLIVGGFLDLLTLLGVFHLTDAERTSIMSILTTLAAAAGLLVPIFQHSDAMTRMRVAALRSADPVVRAREAGL